MYGKNLLAPLWPAFWALKRQQTKKVSTLYWPKKRQQTKNEKPKQKTQTTWTPTPRKVKHFYVHTYIQVL